VQPMAIVMAQEARVASFRSITMPCTRTRPVATSAPLSSRDGALKKFPQPGERQADRWLCKPKFRI
jgi:hypothetical protein